MRAQRSTMPSQLSTVIGIDPGLRATGFAVLEMVNGGLRVADTGEIKPPVRQSLEDRLAALFSELESVLGRWRPQAMALEKVYSEALFPHTAIIMGHVRGVICLAAQRAGAALVEFPPAEAKKALTGSGRASKQQMAVAVAHLLGLKTTPCSEHIADALALAAVATLRSSVAPTLRSTSGALRGQARASSGARGR